MIQRQKLDCIEGSLKKLPQRSVKGGKHPRQKSQALISGGK